MKQIHRRVGSHEDLAGTAPGPGQTRDRAVGWGLSPQQARGCPAGSLVEPSDTAPVRAEKVGSRPLPQHLAGQGQLSSPLPGAPSWGAGRPPFHTPHAPPDPRPRVRSRLSQRRPPEGAAAPPTAPTRRLGPGCRWPRSVWLERAELLAGPQKSVSS